MNFARFSVTRPVAVTMRIASLVLLGLICMLRLPIDLLPKVTIPTVGVTVNWPNVAPEQMESQVTRPVEESVSSVEGLYEVTSTSSLGSSSVRVQLNYGVDVDQAAVDVLQYVNRARASFPTDPNLQNPIVVKYDPSQLPILIYGVSGIDDTIKLNTLLTNEITPILESAGGVASVNVSGGQPRALVIDCDPKKLEAYGLTLADVENRIAQENVSLPAGIAKMGQTEYTIRATGYFTSPEDAERIPLGTFNGALVSLSDVATVKDASQEVRIMTRINGKPAVGITVVKQSDSNTVDTTQNIQDALKTIQKRYPYLHFQLAYQQAGFIEDSLADMKNSALIGGILAIIVITFFLRNFRSTLVVALSIPISIISTFALLYFCGFTLNTISLSGLALATGLIVDDAIVVLENIFRHIERDKRRPAEAAVTGTAEILSAVVASTLTIIVVFLPLFFIKGQAGQTFTQFALVVIFSIAISLLDASTVVPMLASRVISEEEVEEEAHPELRQQRGKKETIVSKTFDRFGRWFVALDASYGRGLKWAIRHRWLVIGAAVLATLLVLPLWPMIGRETLPQTDTGDLSIRMRLPLGTALSTTQAKALQAEKILLADPDVETVFLAIGTNLGFRGTTGQPTAYDSSATVHLKDNRKSTTNDVIHRLQRKLGAISGIRPLATPFDIVSNLLGGNNGGLEIDVFGQNLDQTQKLALQVEDVMRGIPGLESVDLVTDVATPELHWNIDRAKAQSLGVSFTDIANTLAGATNGALTTYYQENGFQYPIYVQEPEADRKSIDELLRLPIKPTAPTVNGSAPAPQVLLGQVATPVVGLGPNQITRMNRQRYLGVSGREVDRSESEIMADLSVALNKMQWPEGTYWDFGDQQKRGAQEFSGLGLAVFMAIALIYMLLASQFESFVYPLIVLTSVPLCAIGVILAFFLSGRSFGLTAFVGLLMLIGIVVKNGILLVDYTNQLRGRGFNRDEAILTAGPTRLRPILMTAFAAVLGMLPLALGIGKGSELQSPLATAVVGGLMTSTFLTLFIVPVVYTIFDDLAKRFRKDDRDLAAPEMVGPSVASTGPVEHGEAPVHGEEPTSTGIDPVSPQVGDDGRA